MKRISAIISCTILLLLAGSTGIYAQFDWDMGPGNFWTRGVSNAGNAPDLTTLSLPVRWTDTTVFPVSAYNGGFLSFNGFTQHLQSSYSPFFDLVYSKTDSFRIEFTWKYVAPYKVTLIISNYNLATAGGYYISVGLDVEKQMDFKGPGASRVPIAAGFGNDTNWHTSRIIFTKNNSTLRAWKDDSLAYTHTSYTFNDNGQATDYTLCIGNTAEVRGTSVYTDSYSYSVQSYSYRGSLSSFKFGKNDSLLEYTFNQVNTQNFVPVLRKSGSIVKPMYPLEFGDRWGSGVSPTHPWILKNGISAGMDSMDAVQYRSGGLKTNYRDCYGELSSLAGFNSGLMTEGFGGEIFVYKDTLYGFGNFNAANGTTGTRSGWDSAKGVTRWNPNTNEWEQLSYGLVTGSGTSGTMFGFGHKNVKIACGYDVTAVGVGTINYVAQYNTGTNLWSAMEAGFNNVAFSGASAYDTAYVGGFFTQANGRRVRFIARWNEGTGKWDSLKGGTNAVVYNVFPDSSTGERQLILGGAFDSTSENGTATYHKGIVVWSVDSNKYKSFHNLNVTTGAVYVTLKNDGWYYFLGDFAGMTDGITTTTSLGMCRWKSGVGLQNIGTGVNSGTSGAGISCAVVIDDILYFGGSFSRVNGMFSFDFGAIDLATGTVMDMGYGPVEKRPEGLCNYNGKVAGIGDNFTANGKHRWIAFLYDPSLNVAE